MYGYYPRRDFNARMRVTVKKTREESITELVERLPQESRQAAEGFLAQHANDPNAEQLTNDDDIGKILRVQRLFLETEEIVESMTRDTNPVTEGNKALGAIRRIRAIYHAVGEHFPINYDIKRLEWFFQTRYFELDAKHRAIEKPYRGSTNHGSGNDRNSCSTPSR